MKKKVDAKKKKILHCSYKIQGRIWIETQLSYLGFVAHMNNAHVYYCSLSTKQLAAYTTFAAHSAALQHSVLGITGAKVFQWMKWCNRFTRFCFQIGGALTCGYIASVLMVMISFISAFNLFRLYSPKHFLRLKGT